MPNTYSWEVHDLIVDPVEGALADVVKKIDCYLVADDGVGNTAKPLASITN